MLGYDDLEKQKKTSGDMIKCPVKLCNQWVPIRKRGDKPDLRFVCPDHGISVTPTTWEYPRLEDNLICTDVPDLDLLGEVLRCKRECRLAHDNSEDAVTWNIFRGLEREGLLGQVMAGVLARPGPAPDPIYWSCASSTRDYWQPLLNARVSFSEAGSPAYARGHGTEPDLVLVGDSVLVFVESKLTADFNTIPKARDETAVLAAYRSAEAHYYDTVFRCDPARVARDLKKYELMRLWLIGSWMAENMHLPFVLLALVRRDDLSTSRQSLLSFQQCIVETADRRLRLCSWEALHALTRKDDVADLFCPVLDRYMRHKTIGYDHRDDLTRAFNLP